MRQDVEEVVDDHREIGVVDALDVVHQLAARFGAHQFVERPAVVLAVALQLAAQELLLVLVFAALLVVVEPPFGHQTVDGQRHQSCEDGVAGVLRRRGENGAVEVVDGHVVVAAQQRVDRTPLVVAEIVDQQQRRLGIFVGDGENARTHERMRHDGREVVAAVDPVEIVAAHEFREGLVGLRLLELDHLLDRSVAGLRQLDVPRGDAPVDVAPVGEVLGHLQRVGDAAELDAVVGRRLLGDELLLVDVLLDRQQYLVGVDGLDDVVGDLRADRLVHDVLLLALGHHDDGRGGAYLLDLGKGFQSGHAGHHLVEDDQVVAAFGGHVDRVVPVVAGVDFIPFLTQEEHVGFQQFDLVVHP